MLVNLGLAVGTWFITMIVLAMILPRFIEPKSGWGAIAILVPFVAAYGAVRWINQKRNEKNHVRAIKAKIQRDRKELDDGITKHRHVLNRNYRQALQKNDYGAVTSDTRKEAVLEFLQSIQFEPEGLSKNEAIEYVCGVLENSQPHAEGQFDPTRFPSNGHEFEHWVAVSLQRFDWDAEVTSGSGDQGIDVIARTANYSVGIQCKLYSQAVGNKAVQEAIAGIRYYGLNIAAVLTNATFTQSAKDLAQAAHVLLLSPHDIPRLKDLCEKIRAAV